MALPQAQLPTIKWAEHSSPLSDAAGMFLAAQEASARRRLAEQRQAEVERAAREDEVARRRQLTDLEKKQEDFLAQQKLENERINQNRAATTVETVNSLLETDPAAAEAIARARGATLTPQDTASKVPELTIPPGADAVSMLLMQSPSAMTKQELRDSTQAAKDATKAQYPGGANPLRINETDWQQPGMEPTNTEESLMLGAMGKGRTKEEDIAIGAARARQQAIEQARQNDVGKYSLTLPGATEPMPLIAGAGRMGKENVLQKQREIESERIGAMGNDIVASLHTGQESPTEMQQLGMLEADFKNIQGLVKSGALNVEQATKQLNAQVARRDALGIWGARLATQETVAKNRPRSAAETKPPGVDELPLTKEANHMVETIARRNDYKPTVTAYRTYQDVLSQLNSGNDALVRRAVGMIAKEASGGSAVVTENELKRYVDEVGGKWQQLEKSWNTLVQTGDGTAIPAQQIKIFSEAMAKGLIPRAEAKLRAITAMVDKSLAENPNVGLRKYRQNAIDQLLGGISPQEPAGSPGSVLQELGL